jgi:hypothetical protein
MTSEEIADAAVQIAEAGILPEGTVNPEEAAQGLRDLASITQEIAIASRDHANLAVFSARAYWISTLTDAILDRTNEHGTLAVAALVQTLEVVISQIVSSDPAIAQAHLKVNTALSDANAELSGGHWAIKRVLDALDPDVRGHYLAVVTAQRLAAAIGWRGQLEHDLIRTIWQDSINALERRPAINGGFDQPPLPPVRA